MKLEVGETVTRHLEPDLGRWRRCRLQANRRSRDTSSTGQDAAGTQTNTADAQRTPSLRQRAGGAHPLASNRQAEAPAEGDHLWQLHLKPMMVETLRAPLIRAKESATS